LKFKKKIEYNFEDHVAQPGSKYYVRWPKHYQKILDSKNPEELKKIFKEKEKRKPMNNGALSSTGKKSGETVLGKGGNLSRPKPPPAKYLYKV